MKKDYSFAFGVGLWAGALAVTWWVMPVWAAFLTVLTLSLGGVGLLGVGIRQWWARRRCVRRESPVYCWQVGDRRYTAEEFVPYVEHLVRALRTDSQEVEDPHTVLLNLWDRCTPNARHALHAQMDEELFRTLVSLAAHHRYAFLPDPQPEDGIALRWYP